MRGTSRSRPSRQQTPKDCPAQLSKIDYIYISSCKSIYVYYTIMYV